MLKLILFCGFPKSKLKRIKNMIGNHTFNVLRVLSRISRLVRSRFASIISRTRILANFLKQNSCLKLSAYFTFNTACPKSLSCSLCTLIVLNRLLIILHVQKDFQLSKLNCSFYILYRDYYLILRSSKKYVKYYLQLGAWSWSSIEKPLMKVMSPPLCASDVPFSTTVA